MNKFKLNFTSLFVIIKIIMRSLYKKFPKMAGWSPEAYGLSPQFKLTNFAKMKG